MNPFELIDQLIKTVTALTGAPLLVVFLWAIGYAVKFCPLIPNRYIPLITLSLSVVIGPFFIGWPECGKMPHDLCCPEATVWLQVMIQCFLIGCGAWLLHDKGLRKLIDSKMFKEDQADPAPPAPPASST